VKAACCSGLKDIYLVGREDAWQLSFQYNLAWLSGRGKYAQLLERDHNQVFRDWLKGLCI